MSIAIVNMTNKGSTGKIMHQVAGCSRAQGITTYTCSPYEYSKNPQKMPFIEGHIYYGSFWDRYFHNLIGRIFGLNGLLSYFATKQLTKYFDEKDVEIIHLHNLHSYCINLGVLFRYIKKNNKKVVWTLHDCWSFTGHCPHFVMVQCDKWKTGCFRCSQYRNYPNSHTDTSKYMYRLKKKWFTNVQQMTIVTPSEWLASLVKESYMQDYDVKVINNGIDLTIFQPSESDFRKKHQCEDKYVLLGVAFDWGKRKGLDVFIELAKTLDERYQIVLVGTNASIDRDLPENIISIHRTENQQELAKIYSAADLFVNPTREENYPTVNMEALACGTPVITFRTGGSPEILDDTCGTVVDVDAFDLFAEEIKRICENKPYSEEACLERAKSFDMNERFKEYVDLYERIS